MQRFRIQNLPLLTTYIGESDLLPPLLHIMSSPNQSLLDAKEWGIQAVKHMEGRSVLSLLCKS
jgi:hypothetical protein